jgi:hypothetical protein
VLRVPAIVAHSIRWQGRGAVPDLIEIAEVAKGVELSTLVTRDRVLV